MASLRVAAARALQLANFSSLATTSNLPLNTGLTTNTSLTPAPSGSSSYDPPHEGFSFYLYIFLGSILVVGAGSFAIYWCHQRRVRRFVEHDNMNNNMQRHSLVDSFIEAGEVEWQCSVCYHENHPAKRECIMCGTPQVISQQAVASPSASVADGAKKKSRKNVASFASSSEEQTLQAARTRSFHVRRLNAMNLNQRQRGARRRNLWQREKTEDGQFRWVRTDDCLPSRISVLTADTSVDDTPRRSLSLTEDDVDAYLYEPAALSNQPRSRSQRPVDPSVGVETELSMHASTGRFSPTVRRLHDSTAPTSFVDSTTTSTGDEGALIGSTTTATSEDGAFISQQSVGYVRHVDANGVVQWVPAETAMHNARAIDTDEFPRATSVIDFEAIAAQPFRHKVRWFLQELDKVSTPWEDGHLLLKIRREAVLNESMHLLMLVPAADLRQRLRIEFIEEPGLDAGGLMREWVLLLCEKLFDESYGLFQATHVENLGYWINPNSSQIQREHLKSYQFIGRLIAKCLLEGQLLTVHFSLPLLKHLLGVPISFSDLEFLDEELFRNAKWLRENDHVENLCLDFSIHRLDAHGAVITDELKPGGKDIPVTDDNKDEYLDLLIKYKMFDSVHEQISAILQGIYDVIPRTLLAVFDYQELELLICGVPNIDVDDWMRHTDVKYQDFEHPTKQEKKVVEWFWETVRSFSQEERARLLQFVTGTSRVPVEGFKALLSNDGRVRRFGIQVVACGVPPTGLYPKAHTCFNRIDVPQYKTREDMETYLTLVINMEITGFSMQ